MKTRDALNAVLLFHSGSPWDPEKYREWQRICREAFGNKGTCEATTRTLCDIVRAALKETTTMKKL